MNQGSHGCRNGALTHETVVELLKWCGRRSDAACGRAVHAEFVKQSRDGGGDDGDGGDGDGHVGAALIRMYSRCGSLHEARCVLDHLPRPCRRLVSWSALISAYSSHHSHAHRALQCFQEMLGEGVAPDVVTFISVLKACGLTRSLPKGVQIHGEISSKGLLRSNIALANSLLDMYAKCGELSEARRVFDELPVRNLISWSVLISGYARHGQAHEALDCFDLMRMEGLSPDAVTFTCISKACASIQCIERGKRIHEDVVDRGLLQGDAVLGNALVDMYAKCGMLANAEELLEALPRRNVVSWNALISGYSQQGLGHEALDCFERMQRDGIAANGVTLSCALKACARVKAAHAGLRIHEEIVKKGLLIEDIVLGNALVDMYAKCGTLAKARQVLSELPHRNVVSWNALIAGYDLHEQGSEALSSFTQMQAEGLHPDPVTFVCCLRACGSLEAADRGKQIHAEIIHLGLLENNIILGNSLICMYSRCGLLTKAEELLNKLPLRNGVSWNALIAGYAQQERWHDTLECFGRMQSEGLSPDAITFTCILRACGNAGAIDRGEQIHKDIVSRSLLDTDTVVGNALVDMYAKCGAVTKARGVHDGLPVRDVVSWNALISGYTQQGQGEDALSCFESMQVEGIYPDATTFSCILKAIGCVGAIDEGKKVHDRIVLEGFLLEENAFLGNAVVDMYAKCHAPEKAHEVLHELPLHTLVAWSAVIEGYTLEGQGHKALECFERMQTEGIFPDGVIFTCSLKACGSTGAIGKGIRIHNQIVSTGSLDKDVELGCFLVGMYAKCGILGKAREVLSKLPVRSVISWNALIAGHVQSGEAHEALRCLDCMQREGLSPDGVTYTTLLKACGQIGAIDRGKQIHDEISKADVMGSDASLANALVEMYAKCGALCKAQGLVDQGPAARDPSAWNVLIAAYLREERAEDALDCFDRMQSVGLPPNEVTYVCVLKACGMIGAIRKGEEIHAEITGKGLLQESVVLGTALVGLYSSCSLLAKAAQVHDELPARDTVSWNAMMTGFAHHGRGFEALDCLRRMQIEGVAPDITTLLCLIAACIHSGLLDEANACFRSMDRDYGIVPNPEIYSCLAVGLGCAGHLDEAMLLMMMEKASSTTASSSSSCSPLDWLVLLGCCRKWGNLGLGRSAFNLAIRPTIERQTSGQEDGLK